MFANLKRIFKKPPPVEKKIVPVASTELRLRDWQTMPDLVTGALRLKSDPVFSLMLQVLRNEAPQNYVRSDLGDTEALLEFGRVQGFQRALNILEAFPKQAIPTRQVESTFLESVEEIKPIPFTMPSLKEKANG